MNFLAGLVLYAIVFGPSQQFVVPEVTQIESNSALAAKTASRRGTISWPSTGKDSMFRAISI